MEHYIYLSVNFFSVIICFLFSFHPKIKFNRQFTAFFKSAFLVAFFFIIWDIWFTERGVWWFNNQYILGPKIGGLPIEELLFFICIPFSCVFTYFCLDKFFKLDVKPSFERVLAPIFIISFAIISLLFKEKIYTFVTFSTVSVSIFLLFYIFKIKWFGKAFLIYLILTPGFLLVNGILTGTGLESPIVSYNPLENLGIRILTIPIEDFFYGYELILWNLFFFFKFKERVL